MTPTGRAERVALAVSAALLVAYAVIWTRVSPVDIGRSDFTAFYVGGTLLREGHGASLYDEALQAPLHAGLIAPDREGNLPFVDPPVAAAVVLPVTLLGLDSAYRVWALFEVAVLAGAVVLAVRTAARSATLPVLARAAAGGVAFAGIGTLFAWTQAQWTPVFALGLAAAFACWRRGDGLTGRRDAAIGAAALLAGAAIGKPQLALGLIAFLLGWHRRGLLLGGMAAVAGIAAVSLVLAGPGGLAGFVRIVAGSTTRWDPHVMLGASGLAAAFAGSGVAAVVLSTVITLLACSAAFVLGARVRRNPHVLPIALAGAAALSLLAAPHAYLDDLSLLAPAAAWVLVTGIGGARGSGVRAGTARMALVAPALALWVALSVAAVIDLATGGRLNSGPLTAYALAASGAAALVATAGPSRRLLRYRGADEAAVGAVAHGLRHG